MEKQNKHYHYIDRFLKNDFDYDILLPTKIKKRANIGFEIKREMRFKKTQVFKDCLSCANKNLLPSGVVSCLCNKKYFFDAGCKFYEVDR